MEFNIVAEKELEDGGAMWTIEMDKETENLIKKVCNCEELTQEILQKFVEQSLKEEIARHKQWKIRFIFLRIQKVIAHLLR